MFDPLLACPICRADLRRNSTGFRCVGCGHQYALDDGIPLLISNPSDSLHDEVQHLGEAHNRQQRAFFDSADQDFEISRPRGSPEMYRWLLENKFSRATDKLGGVLPGSRVLVVCGGSGMDAEFLARRGAHVLSSDISIGAAKRASERARRRGLSIEVMVADVQRLPVKDCSFDLVYVHDGLHHLTDPYAGLKEMMRVTRGGLSVTEPSRALVTSVALRLGLAAATEDSGNIVGRMKLDLIVGSLEQAGFKISGATRYLMYYKHRPGPVMRLVSRQPLLSATKFAVTAANLILARVGNKLSVQAFRKLADKG
jgi:SAM-dependent methyltransferase